MRLVPALFLLAITLGTMLLALPVSKAGAGSAPPLVALFTATSAVTGVITVDTATYWSAFGQSVILLLFQVGGFGIMTAAVVLGLVHLAIGSDECPLWEDSPLGPSVLLERA